MSPTTQAEFYDAYRHTASVHGVTERGRALLNLLAREGRLEKPEIIARMGIGDRTVRKEVELLRRAGVPVLSSSGDGRGYWLSVDLREIDEFVHHEIDSRIASLQEQRERLLATVEFAREVRA